MDLSVSESAHEDEEHGARGARSPGESGPGEEIGATDEDRADLPLRMDTDMARGWKSGARGGFLRGIGQRVSFDPEAPPPPPQPARKIDEKVKVSDLNVAQDSTPVPSSDTTSLLSISTQAVRPRLIN